MSAVHMELLLGRRVHDASGRMIGRIFEIRAIRRGALCFVECYVLGAAGIRARLGLTSSRLLGFRSRGKPTTVPWRFMDLTDPQRPTLKITWEELEAANKTT